MGKTFAALAIATLFILAGCATQEQQSQITTQGNGLAEFTIKLIGPGLPEIELAAEAKQGTTLFRALQENGVEMSYNDYPFGKMVTSLWSIEPGPGQYLAVYVDGEYSEKGVDAIIPEQGQVIEFRLEEIK